ncbi:tyrosine-protein phosphatase non-receptor type substrate 1-like isoform X1 [Polypterus senegalus]|uniref:tyrosine-protein phosphatase non-receptor type substrate 1-like isoform X1 n=1 Tax=Polypterus senegalus TaxID=55291 RepID=UPI0019668FAB|nr:tyrosine-protein phosphatase non-receptor type substrate 1-like isoform X1 [Polypterus senegalus]
MSRHFSSSRAMGLHLLFSASVVLLLSYSRGLQILQPQMSLKTEEFKTVTLVCVLSSDQPLGPVRWYKEAGSTRTHLYSAAPMIGETNDPRVIWMYESTTVNFSILIRDVRVSDTGTYYCVKYKKGLEDHPIASGPGVSLTVAALQHAKNEMEEDTTENLQMLNDPDVSLPTGSTSLAVGLTCGFALVILLSGLGFFLYRKAKGRNLMTMKRDVCYAHTTTHESKTADDTAHPSMQYVHYNLRGVQNEREEEYEEYEEPIFDSLEFRTLKKETDSLSSLDNIYANTTEE